MVRRSLLSVIFLLTAALILIDVADAQCLAAGERQEFTANDSGSTILLCGGEYLSTFTISGASDLIFDCNGAYISAPTGIIVQDSARVTVRNCIFSGTEDSILVRNVNSLTLDKNTFKGASTGAFLQNVMFASIRGNLFSNSRQGLYLKDSQSFEISRNSFEGNRIGLYLEASSQGKIVHNLFNKPSGENTFTAFADEASIGNSWFDESGGNYWSDYAGEDSDGDGIGDVPYYISPNNVDEYPIVLASETSSKIAGMAVSSLDEGNSDEDGDGFTKLEGDCDDTNPEIYPGAEEQCSDVLDYDCDGLRGDADPDCRGLGIGFWVLILLAISIGAAAVYFMFFWKGSQKEEVETTEEQKAPIKPTKSRTSHIRDVSAKVRRIMDYAENYFDKGYSEEQVREILLAEGWSHADINVALKRMSTEGFVKPASRHPDLSKLREAIKRNLAKGKTPREIINALKEKGWDDKVIKVILKDVEKQK